MSGLGQDPAREHGVRALPVAVPLEGCLAVVVGAGPVAARKVQELLDAGASVRVIAPAASTEFGRFSGEPLVTLVAREWRESDIARARVVVAATDDPLLNARIARAAQSSGALVNVVDRPELCTFYSMAVVRRGSLAIGITTGGACPGLAARLRRELEAVFDGRWGELTGRLGTLRAWAGRYVTDASMRTRLLRSITEPHGPPRAQRDLRRNDSVKLVGAGPGSADLITIRGLNAVREADVIVFDRLVAPELLLEARAGAELIDVGKVAGNHAVDQQAINALLIERASRGLRVCRLKGGDPCVFGRGAEEALALAAAGLRAEFIPGVSSAIAAPECAGVPVTLRGVASSFTVVTGHASSGEIGDAEEWRAFANVPGTLVVLMGMKNLARITAALIAQGKDPDTPAALIRWGATEQQEFMQAELSTIAEAAVGARWAPPSVLVVGDVVGVAAVLARTDTAAWCA